MLCARAAAASALLATAALTRSVPPCAALGADESLMLPEKFVAPPEPREEGVVCTVSHLEMIALHNTFARAKPDNGVVNVELEDCELSVDLGLRKPLSAVLTPSYLKLVVPTPSAAAENEKACLPWAVLAKVAKKKRAGVWECYDETGEGGEGIEEPYKVEGMSELTSRTASLYPAEGLRSPPTAVLGGFNMHRTKGMDPNEDTRRKLAALGKVRGRMLDVCTGLGYTSIAAAKLPTVSEVVTIELDPLMVYLQRANPWSNDLFEDGKIRRLVGDATEVLPALPDGRFDAVIHDPPANALSGELYSLSFYSELRRVLRPGGLLYHYIGDPSSKASGKLFKGIHERLREAGFASTSTDQQAYGIVARVPPR